MVRISIRLDVQRSYLDWRRPNKQMHLAASRLAGDLQTVISTGVGDGIQDRIALSSNEQETRVIS
jgi:hypothetical protein